MNFENTLKEYSNKIRYLNYSKRTEEIYVHYFEKFLIDRNKYPIQLKQHKFTCIFQLII